MNPQHEDAQTVTSMTMTQVLRSAMDIMLEHDNSVVVFGQDVGYFDGMFRCTGSLQKEHGTSRVSDVPIFKSGIIGTAVGMGAYGPCLVVEIQFASYVYPASDQLIPGTARLRHRSTGDSIVPMTVCMPYGSGIYDGQTYSQGLKAIFAQVYGLRTVMPSNPYDAKDLLIAYIENDDPVIFLEFRRLHNGLLDGHHDRPVTPWSKYPASQAPDGYYKVPLDRATIVRPGAALAVLAYGTIVYAAQAVTDEIGLGTETIDLRSLWPLDPETTVASVKKTGCCVIAHEATHTYGFDAELMSLMQEHCSHHLEASIERVTGWDTPYPHAQGWAYFPGSACVGAAFKRVIEV